MEDPPSETSRARQSSNDVNRDNPLPLYHQAANVLRSRIDTGEWGPGERIPSESSLAASFGVSIVTMRQALEVLKRQGLIYGRQGLGTFVSNNLPPDRHVALSVPLSAVSAPIADLEVRALSCEEARPPAWAREMLGLAETEPCIRVRRVRVGPHGPVTYATTYIPLAVGGDLNMEELNDSLMIDILERRGFRFTGAFQTIEASLADHDTASTLGVAIGAPTLLVRRRYVLDTGKVGYVVLNRHPSHMFRYEVELRRGVGQTTTWGVAAATVADNGNFLSAATHFQPRGNSPRVMNVAE